MLFDAAVVKVNMSGSVDVKYDIDGSGGIFLTVEQHGLKLLGDEEKKEGGGVKKKVCVVGGCPSIAYYKGQLCTKHGGKPCSVDGCSTKAAARGVCNAHGAHRTCSFNKCTSAVRIRGRCGKHGGRSKKVCKEEGCTTLALARGVCAKHGARGTCKFEGCTTNAASGSPHCKKHGGGKKKKPCSVAGCTTNAVRKGLCTKHSGGPGECVFGGCTNTMVSTKWKTCITHGGLGYCAYVPEGRGYVFERKCWTPARKWGGNCYKHTRK